MKLVKALAFCIGLSSLVVVVFVAPRHPAVVTPPEVVPEGQKDISASELDDASFTGGLMINSIPDSDVFIERDQTVAFQGDRASLLERVSEVCWSDVRTTCVPMGRFLDWIDTQ